MNWIRELIQMKKKIIAEKNWYMAHDITTQVTMPAQQQL